jgi:hypothetical protein
MKVRVTSNFGEFLHWLIHYWLQKDRFTQFASDSLHIRARSQFNVTLFYTAANIAIYMWFV